MSVQLILFYTKAPLGQPATWMFSKGDSMKIKNKIHSILIPNGYRYTSVELNDEDAKRELADVVEEKFNRCKAYTIIPPDDVLVVERGV